MIFGLVLSPAEHSKFFAVLIPGKQILYIFKYLLSLSFV